MWDRWSLTKKVEEVLGKSGWTLCEEKCDPCELCSDGYGEKEERAEGRPTPLTSSLRASISDPVEGVAQATLLIVASLERLSLFPTSNNSLHKNARDAAPCS